MQRIYLASLLTATLTLWGCESGTSSGPQPIAFAASAPSGQGFVAVYAPPPFDILPYPNDIYNPVAAGTGAPADRTRLSVGSGRSIFSRSHHRTTVFHSAGEPNAWSTFH